MREGFAALIQAAAEWRHVGHRDLRVTGFRYMSPGFRRAPRFLTIFVCSGACYPSPGCPYAFALPAHWRRRREHRRWDAGVK